MERFLKFDKIVSKISRMMVRISAGAMFFIAAVSFIDMLGRYLLQNSLKGAQDLVEVAMCVFVYAGLAMAVRQRKIIMVPVILDLMKNRPREIIIAIGNLACFVMAIFLISQLYQSTLTMADKLIVGTAILKIPHMPFYAFVTFGFVMIALELFILVVKDLNRKYNETSEFELELETVEITEGE